ncbi:MAG: hypothetical protein K6F09_02815 [Clostridiales bacterium]|nr:hypothetical protein [Clostridiales bacterium]
MSFSGQKSETFTFEALPKNLEELKALPECDLSSPFKTAALTVLVLCNYGNDVEETYNMLNYIKGPRELSVFEKQFLRDRLGGKEYKPFSFLAGTSPDNNYEPSKPYKITVFDGMYSYNDEGYAKLFIRSSGADTERPLTLRAKGGTTWYLWEQFLLSDIRIPKKDDPWA